MLWQGHQVKYRVALVRVPFYFIDLWLAVTPTAFSLVQCLVQRVFSLWLTVTDSHLVNYCTTLPSQGCLGVELSLVQCLVEFSECLVQCLVSDTLPSSGQIGCEAGSQPRSSGTRKDASFQAVVSILNFVLFAATPRCRYTLCVYVRVCV